MISWGLDKASVFWVACDVNSMISSIYCDRGHLSGGSLLVPRLWTYFLRMLLLRVIVLTMVILSFVMARPVLAQNALERQMTTHQKDIATSGSWVAQRQAVDSAGNTGSSLQAGIQFRETAPEPNWWLNVHDPYLARYIEQALIHNPDAQAVRLNIQR